MPRPVSELSHFALGAPYQIVEKAHLASEQHDNDDNLIVNRQHGEQLNLKQLY